MKKKRIQITADIFNSKPLTTLMDFLAFISPAKTVDEEKIRNADREKIRQKDFGKAIERTPSNINGTLDRNRILLGVSLFGDVPKINEDDIKLISDGGFDFVLSMNGGEYGRQILDWCDKYNLSAISTECTDSLSADIRTLNYSKNIFENFTPHKASVGDNCWDEPVVEDFSFIAKFHKAYKEHFPDRFLFTNLLPGLEIESMLGVKAYREYLKRFSETVDTDYVSADIYPFHPAKFINRFEMAICLHTYHCIGEICRKENKDFWLYIQAQGKWFSHLYTMTTYEMMKWQVYTALCYGVRSFIYVSYNPVWGNDAVGFIDYKGNLTEQYLYAKRINEEIQRLSPVLKDYRSIGVEFVKSKKNNPHFIFGKEKQKKNNKIDGFSSITKVKNIHSESTVIAGYFENKNGENALMLVNCKNIYSPYASQKITVEFNERVSLRVYKKGKPSEEKNATEITVNSDSCDGVFITFR